MGYWSTSAPGVTFGDETYLGVLNQTNFKMQAYAATARGVGTAYYIKMRVKFSARSGNYITPSNYRVYAAGDYSSYYYPPSSAGNSDTYYYYGSGGSTGSSLSVNVGSTAYSPGGTVSGSVSVPAIATYPVTFNANGGTGTTASQTKVSGEALTISGCSFTKDGYNFTAWNTAADGSGTTYAAGASYTANAALTLYAQWEAAASQILTVDRDVETLGTISLQVDRKSSAYWHKATYLLGQTSLLVSSAFETALSTSVPRSWFANSPNDAVISVTLSVQTYTDSSCTTTVGNPVTTTISVTADAGMVPTVASGWATVAPYNTGGAAQINKFIKNISRAEATFDSTKITNATGATTAGYAITYKGVSTSASPYRTAVLAETAVTVVCTVTDSRGRSTSQSFPLSVEDYTAPTITRTAIFHCLSDGTQDEGGYFLSVTAKLTCTGLSGDNTVTATVAVAPNGGSYGTETALVSETASILSSYSPDLTWTVRITATDTIGTAVVYEQRIPARAWTMHFKSNGRGVAFGKASEYNDTFEINDNWAVKSQGIVNLLYPVGSVYLSTSSTNPSAYFGGTWVELQNLIQSVHAWERTA